LGKEEKDAGITLRMRACPGKPIEGGAEAERWSTGRAVRREAASRDILIDDEEEYV
jgi:hypothetical protein